MTTDTQTYDFDVALSFAGEDREYVEEVNAALKAVGIKTFLDADYLADTWGEDLVEFFDAVYRLRARFAILFISRHYAEKTWPRQERRSAIARAVVERGAYVLPVRLDDTEMDGLRPTVGYLDSRKTGIDGLARALTAKLAGRPGSREAWPGDRVPRTAREVAEVRSLKPPAWEYLLFAGYLYLGKEALEPKFLDHELGYAAPGGHATTAEEAVAFMRRSSIQRVVGTLMAMMEAKVQERAFGPLGTEGDPDRIEHLATRWNSAYADLLDWNARIRGTAHDHMFTAAFDLLARTADLPIRQYREFVNDFVSKTDGVPSALARHERLEISLVLTLSLEEGISEAFGAELERLADEM